MKAVFKEFGRSHVALSYDDADGKRVQREFIKHDNGLIYEVFYDRQSGDRYEYVRDGLSNTGSPVIAFGPLIETIRVEYQAMRSAQKQAQAQLDGISAGPGVRHLGGAPCGI
ncbi:hypothetical protein ELG63_36475 [Rhizobium leguminosarum]|uniref:hypothetical protein n=1 Tax=Rhizobium leguminosarum TaxID=384 RepID=UPI0010314CC1|nr:hypothetical protein [Rhizobium leguminosarum]TBH28186.1 hypothetical protein ELG63_36475 [Rhizobium leguminosarum]